MNSQRGPCRTGHLGARNDSRRSPFLALRPDQVYFARRTRPLENSAIRSSSQRRRPGRSERRYEFETARSGAYRLSRHAQSDEDQGRESRIVNARLASWLKADGLLGGPMGCNHSKLCELTDSSNSITLAEPSDR
jgi:hypothetical protein